MELITVDPKEYGLTQDKAQELTKDLSTIRAERDILEKQYNEIIKKDIEDDKTQEEARELRLRIRDNRTKGINVWHKENKAFYLAASNFIDATKRKELVSNERMEARLKDIEDVWVNLEKQRIQELKEKREAEIEPYIEEGDLEGMNLGEMSDDIWESVFEARKNSFEKKQLEAKREEEERVERERKQKLHNERKDSLIPVWNFLKSVPEDLSELTEKAFDSLLKEGKEGKAKDDAEKEKLRQKAQKVQERNNKMRELWSYTDLDSVEDLTDKEFDVVVNEAKKAKSKKDEELRLQKEAEEKANNRIRTLMPYWNFLNIEEETVKDISDKEFEELLKNGKALKQKDDERKAREVEEAKRKEKARKSLEASSDKVKLITFTESLLELEIPKVKDEKAVKVATDIKKLLNKIDNYVKEKL